MTRAQLLANASSEELEEWRAFLVLEQRAHKLIVDAKLQPENAYKMVWDVPDGEI
jgi:hypothetical protein